MKVKLSNERIVKDAKALGALTEKKLPIKVSYAIAKNITKIEAELKIYNQERQKLIEKYSSKDDNGDPLVEDNSIVIADEFKEDWNRDYKELLAIENEIEIHKFHIDELLNSNCNFTPAELMLIDYMIEE